MAEIKKIIVPTDFSKPAGRAFDYVADLTKDRPDKQVTFLHVVAKDVDDKPILNQLDQLKESFCNISRAHCEVKCLRGNLIEEILNYQVTHGQDMIVMGTAGSESEDVYTRSAEIVHKADCPVLVVPHMTEQVSAKNIVLALDKNVIDDSDSLGVLHAIAREKNARVHILTIEEEASSDFIVENPNEGILEYYLETLDFKYVFPKNSDIEKGIHRYIQAHNIDLLVILPRNHAKNSKPSEGKLTQLLTLHTTIPLLSID